MNDNVIKAKSRLFALRIIKLYKYLKTHEKELVLSRQVLRSGTSIGANVVEAHNAMSKKEFIAKMNIALKETAETAYWLDLLKSSDYISQKQFESINNDCTEIKRLITAIIKTSVKNSN